MLYFTSLLLFSAEVFRKAVAIPIDNGVASEPVINCGNEEISFWVDTEKEFTGKTFVKGEYERPECVQTFGGGSDGGNNGDGGNPFTTRRPDECPPCPACAAAYSGEDYSGGFPGTGPEGAYRKNVNLRYKRQAYGETGVRDKENDPRMAHLTVRMGTCRIRRERSLNPSGVTVTFTVVVSFHQHFITKVDRAYQIRCFYMEADKTVRSEIDVSMPQTTELNAQGLMPECQYTIRRGSPEGPIVRFARVGDQVFHRWQCLSETPGQKVMVIDRQGCSMDSVVLGSPSYETTLDSAAVESHVFKFADRAALEFQCSISVCVTADGGCARLTPPQCGRLRVGRSALNGSMYPMDGLDRDASQWLLHADTLTILDLDENVPSEELEQMEERLLGIGEESLAQSDYPFKDYYNKLADRIGPRVCLSVVGFGVLVSLSTFVFTVAALVAGSVYVLRRRKYPV